MHVPDGFIDAPVSVATGVVAAAAVAVSLRGARRELGDAGGGSGGSGGLGGLGGSGGERTAPLAGLVAAFIFAVQMLNFPVAAGTSGHLLGGALAAILVGPYTGVLCVSVVLLMQGVLFADGGLTALGVNITDMAVVTTVVAYAVFRAILKLTPRRRRSVTVASFVAALLSVPAAAVAFTAIYALGGTTHVSLGKVFTAMVGVHVLIGIGEAVITALTVSAVVSVRPDLVYGARGLTRTLEIRASGVATPAPGAAGPATAIPATAPGAAPEALSGGVAARAAELAPGTTTGPAPSAARPAGTAARAAAASAAGGVAAGAAERGEEAGAAPRSATASLAVRSGSEEGAPGVGGGTGAGADAASAAPGVAPGAGADDVVSAPTGAASAAAATSAAGGVAARVSERDEEAGAAQSGGKEGVRTVGQGVGAGAAAPAASGLAAAPGASLGTSAAQAGDAASGGVATPAGAGAVGATDPTPAARRSARRVWAVGVAAALLCAGVVSFYASASPDGLEKVAHDNGIDKKTEDHASKDSPLADYGVKDISDARLSGGLAGVIGVGATLAVGSGLFIVVRRRTKKAAAGPAAVPSAHHSETV